MSEREIRDDEPARTPIPGFATLNPGCAYYYVLLATPGTPPAVAGKLRDEVAKAVTAAEVIELFDKQGMKPSASEPDATAHMLAADLARWTDVVAKAGIEAK